MSGGLTVRALPTPVRFRAGDDLAATLLAALDDAGEQLQPGDVVCVASKVVALVEDMRTAGDDARMLARVEAAEIVADAPWVLITRTSHGFVAANGGIDRSNVADDGLPELLMLPDDPDASAERLRCELRTRTGVTVGVIVTDTFGRAWRLGQTDVALGLAGLAALRDERGAHDLDGRPLTVTRSAVADEIAGVADLVRDKASGTPFVLVRGLGEDIANRSGTGRDLIRDRSEDLFRFGGADAVEQGIAARRTVREFDRSRTVPQRLLERAVDAAACAPAPHHTRPWRVLRLLPATRTALLDAMSDAWRADLRGDGLDEAAIERRITRSDAVLREAPELLVLNVERSGAHGYRDERRRTAERDLFLLAGGAAIEALLVTLAAHGLGAAWVSSTVFCPATVRDVLALDADHDPLGMIAVGWPRSAPPVRAPHPGEGLLEDR